MNILMSLVVLLSVFCNSVQSESSVIEENKIMTTDCSCCVIGDYFDTYPIGPWHDPNNPDHVACYETYLAKHKLLANQLISVINTLCLPCLPGEQFMKCCPCVKSIYEDNLWVEGQDLNNWIDYLACTSSSS